MRLTKRATVTAAVALTTAGAAFFGVQMANADDSTQATGSPATALSERTTRSFERLGTEFVPQTPDQLAEDGVRAVSQDAAEKDASGTFAFIRGKAPSEVVSGRLTLPTGEPDKVDPSQDSRPIPTFKDRPVWLIVYQDLKTPIYGPVRPAEDKPEEAQYQDSGLWIAVDAATGKFLGAQTVDY